MTASVFAKIIDTARVAGASDVHINVKPDQIGIKHRIGGEMFFIKNDLKTPELVEVVRAEMAVADMGANDSVRFSDWLEGRQSEFRFRHAGFFVQGELIGDAKHFQIVIRLFSGPAEYAELLRRMAVPAN